MTIKKVSKKYQKSNQCHILAMGSINSNFQAITNSISHVIGEATNIVFILKLKNCP
jgi:hypothetical protein